MENTINNYLENNFTAGEISPTTWSKKIFKTNITYMISEFLILSLLGGLLFSLLNISKEINLGWSLFAVSSVLAGIRLIGQLQRNMDFLTVPYGHIGIIRIMEDVKGSLDKSYHLKPGKYRNIVSLIFFPNLFDIILVPTDFKNYDSVFSKVYTKDGHELQGAKTEVPQLVNPWIWSRVLFAAKDKNIHFEKIDDISFNAMNAAADNHTISEIMKSSGADASEAFKKSYVKELAEMKERLTSAKKPFIDEITPTRDDTFYFKEIGLNVTFGIKNREPADAEMRAALAAEGRERELSKAKIIKAEADAKVKETDAAAEKIRLTLEGEGQAAADHIIAKMASDVFNEAYKKNMATKTMTSKDASHKAALTTNAWTTEILSDIGNSDGTPLKGGGFDVAKIFALIKAFQAGKGDDNISNSKK